MLNTTFVLMFINTVYFQLRSQPFLDYFFNTGLNEQWENVGGPPLRVGPRSVVESPQDFDCCDRLQAMRAASHMAAKNTAPPKAF